MAKKKIYLVIVQDTIVQSREYAVLCDDEIEAKANVTKGMFLTESEATTMDTIESKVISATKVGTTE